MGRVCRDTRFIYTDSNAEMRRTMTKDDFIDHIGRIIIFQLETHLGDEADKVQHLVKAQSVIQHTFMTIIGSEVNNDKTPA